MKPPVLGLLILSAVALAACDSNAPSNPPAGAQSNAQSSAPAASTADDPAKVETMVSEYYGAIGAYDYAKMRSMYSPEWEIFDDGQRLDADGFEALVKGLQQRKMTWQFAIEDFDTEIVGDRAYTNYVITNTPERKWFGTAFLKRSGDGWLFDHMVMMTERRPGAGGGQQPGGNPATRPGNAPAQ